MDNTKTVFDKLVETNSNTKQIVKPIISATKQSFNFIDSRFTTAILNNLDVLYKKHQNNEYLEDSELDQN